MIEIKEIEKAIGIPVDQWAGRCFEIASKIVEADLVEGKAVYGHYLGPIDSDSLFSVNKPLGFCQHGWIRTKDKLIDPTRFVFQKKHPYDVDEDSIDEEPYVFSCHFDDDEADNYDEGGNKFRMQTIWPAPKHDPKLKQISIEALDEYGQKPMLPDPNIKFVKDVIFNGDEILDLHQAFYLAKLDPKLFDPEVAFWIYDTLEKAGQKALVPIDNWNLVMEPSF